jgi:hypothetical protein
MHIIAQGERERVGKCAGRGELVGRAAHRSVITALPYATALRNFARTRNCASLGTTSDMFGMAETIA